MVNITTPINILDANTPYTLMNDIVMTGPFTSVGTGVLFNGNGHTITINNVTGFPGLFPAAVTVKNLGILSTGSLADGAGWLFATTIGGTATNCYSTGDINGQMCGGIFGQYSSGRAENCYSTGKIGKLDPGNNTIWGSGGIFGGDSTIDAVANGCYSIGDQVISFYGNGGIFGPQCKGQATNCYSTGIITTIWAGGGGIFGFLSSGSATNCYSTGPINTDCGGIFGEACTGQAKNCYSTGAFKTSHNIIFGFGSQGTAVTNSGHTDGWINTSANQYLTGDPADTTPPRIWLVNPGYNTNDSFMTNLGSTLNDIRPYIILLPPTAESPQIFASGKTVANLVATGTAIKWYNALTGGTALATTYQLTSGTYYASQTIDGDESSRTGVDITVTHPPIVINATSILYILAVDTTYTLDADIVMTAPFSSVGAGVVFDGSGHTITINNTVNFPGLFGTAVTVKNLGIKPSGTTTLAVNAGWFFKAGTFATMGGTATNCYSTGAIATDGGGIFGRLSSGTATNCYSTGTIGGGGIFGTGSSGIATNCYSTGTIGGGVGGIFGLSSSGIATNCYSTGDIGDVGGGIFGYYSLGSATNCYSTGRIGSSGGGIFGYQSSGSAIATNCYSTGYIGERGGGIFGNNSSGTARNCYSTGDIGERGGGIFSSGSSGIATNCGYSVGWINASANHYLTGDPVDNTSPQVWYSSIAGKHYTLSPITTMSTMSIYPTSFTIVTDHGTQQLNTISAEWSDIATWSSSDPTIATVSASGIVTAIASGTTTITATLQNLSTISSCTISIPATGITIDSVIHYMAYTATLQLHASVLPISAIHTTFTWSSSDKTIATIDNNGLLQAQSTSGTTIITATSSFNNTLTDIKRIIVSADGSVHTYIIPITDTTPLDLSSPDTIYQLTKNIEYTQSITVSAPHITFDGNGHTITINNVNGFTGLFSTAVTVKNLGITTSGTTTLADEAGWFFKAGTSATVTMGGTATKCYSTGAIGQYGGGIFGQYSSGTATNCYSTGDIVVAGGGIFGYNCTGTAKNCYSTGRIGGSCGGISGYCFLGSATNCYSTGRIGSSGGGIFGQSSSGIATNCYSIGTISTNGGGIFGYNCTGTATNCYTTGTSTGYHIFGPYGIHTETKCGFSTGWNNTTANQYLTGDPADTTPPRIWLVNPGYNTNDIRPYIILLPPTAESPQTFATGKTVSNLVATGTAIKWYTTITDGNVLAPTTVLTSTTYYASQTIDGGESSRTRVDITVTPPPIVQSAQTFATRQPIVNVANKNPMNSSYGSDTITANASGIAISSSVTTFYNEMNTVPHRVNVKPIFSSYRDYMLYLQNRM